MPKSVTDIKISKRSERLRTKAADEDPVAEDGKNTAVAKAPRASGSKKKDGNVNLAKSPPMDKSALESRFGRVTPAEYSAEDVGRISDENRRLREDIRRQEVVNRKQKERIDFLESEKTDERIRKKMKGAARWESVRFTGDEEGNQDVVNNLVKDHIHKVVKYVPGNAFVLSNNPKSLCVLAMRGMIVPAGVTKEDYWMKKVGPAIARAYSQRGTYVRRMMGRAYAGKGLLVCVFACFFSFSSC